jgi:hypothetical protein
MWHFLRALLSTKSSKSPNRVAPQARLELEPLEERQVLSVTNHGGAVLPHVEVQAMYYGSDWKTSPGYARQIGNFDNSLKSLVSGSYMDMLGNAGYGVGRGSVTPGAVDGVTLDKTKYVTDGALRASLQTEIFAGQVAAPDANRLYVIFVEDGVVVQDNVWDKDAGRYHNSIADMGGYHSAFQGQYWSSAMPYIPQTADVRYAVIPYAGGVNAFGSIVCPWLNSFDMMTLATSHEVAEAVTDPDAGYKTYGWTDDHYGEVGDIVAGQTVYLNNYAVQQIADKNDQAMTPQGAGPVHAVNFVLSKNGGLFMSGSSGLTQIASGIASVSDQGVGIEGHAMVDVVSTTGTAWQYEEGIGWTRLADGVKMAKAGHGVSYVLFNDGTLKETTDAGKSWMPIDQNVTAIDAGTDRYGVNMVTEVWYGLAYEHSDSTGWHFVASNVKAVSAGQMGNIAFIHADGAASVYSEASGSTFFVASGVAQITAGTDENGKLLTEVLFANGDLWELHANGWWASLDGSVTSISKAHAGVLDAVFSWGYAYTHDDASGFYCLASTPNTAAV